MPAPDQAEILRIKKLQLQLQELSRPFIALKCDILAVALPKYLRSDDGKWSVIYDDSTTAGLKQVDDLWNEEVKAFLRRESLVLSEY